MQNPSLPHQDHIDSLGLMLALAAGGAFSDWPVFHDRLQAFETALALSHPHLPAPCAEIRAHIPQQGPVAANDPRLSAGTRALEKLVGLLRSTRAEPVPQGDFPPICLDLESDLDMAREFSSEFRENLHRAEQCILALERNPSDSETINALHRAFHNIKGDSGFLNLVSLSRVSHELETLLETARQRALPVSSRMASLMLRCLDLLKSVAHEMDLQISGKNPSTPIPVPAAALVAELSDPALLQSSAPSGPSAEDVSLPSGNSNEGDRATVKINTSKLDALVDLAGEMVIAHSLIEQDPLLVDMKNTRLGDHFSQLTRITRDIQKMAMQLRMVPVRPVFARMSRLVRDLSQKLGKPVSLQLEGEDTEIDRGVIDILAAPLVHMIRNSMDHGLESPADRKKAGKPETGIIRLRAFHRGGHIVVEISDDGAGLNRVQILRKAMEKGLLQSSHSLSDRDIDFLIFKPGFSTASTVSDISGRGVGLDVVLQGVQKINGSIDLHSIPGAGTTFTITVPLTLAIIEGIMIGAGTQTFVLPSVAIREMFSCDSRPPIMAHHNCPVVSFRGELIPVLHLADYLSIPSPSKSTSRGIIVIIEAENRTRALQVDSLLGKAEFVVKGLDEGLAASRKFAGATILGNGQAGLILNVIPIVHLNTPSPSLTEAA
ncbi:MAG: chemotaxis protein CheA [Verrucomicrobiae bacterium]|nr:chemotaxis protein CheA [Verrucomicrobiae bacterium]